LNGKRKDGALKDAATRCALESSGFQSRVREPESGLALRDWRGGGRGGAADGVAVDDEFDAAVALAAFGGVVGSDWLHFAEAAGGDGGTGHALLGQEVTDGVGAAFGELLVEVIAADTVGVAFDLEREAGMREDDTGNFGELFAGAGLECVAAGVKEHIGHVDDEAAGGVARLQNGIELAEKLGAKLGFLGFGLGGGLAGFFGFGLSSALLLQSFGAVASGLVGGGLRGLLLGKSGGAGFFGFRFLAGSFGGGLLSFLLHALGFRLGGFGLLASFLRVLAALGFR
jgi:hypothetical protein